MQLLLEFDLNCEEDISFPLHSPAFQGFGSRTIWQPPLERILQRSRQRMRETNTKYGKVVDLALLSCRGIHAFGCLLFLWCGAFLAFQCHALSIREALGMIESGEDDHAIGSAGEISRYQIKKAIWQSYSASSSFWDKNEAWRIAEKVLATRIEEYHRRTGHAPAPFDIYVLWNAPGKFQNAGYERKLISGVVAERATRFANLVERPEPSTRFADSQNSGKGQTSIDRSDGARQFAAVIRGTN